MVRHHDYGVEPLPKPAPEPSPNPKPLIPAGTPHPGVCRYPVEMGWVQTAMDPWQKSVLPAVGWTESTRRWLFAMGGVVLAGLLTLGLALGSTCRAAGAQEERLTQVREAQALERSERIESDKQIDLEQGARYERLFDLLVKVHSDVQVLKVQRAADDAQSARRPTSR